MTRSKAPRTVADTLAQAIASDGTRLVFGHPGGEVTVLIDALRRAGVRFLLTRHETTAAFMGIGLGELTGHPGVCVATLGPGATNMVTGVASALLERAPLIALTGALASDAPPGTTHQALDLTRLYAAVAKRSVAITADNAGDAIADALHDARCPRAGPVHLSVPSDIAATPVANSTRRTPATRAVPTAAPGAAEARRMLGHSTHPAVIVGLGAQDDRTARAVQGLAHRLRAPVAATPKGKGIFAEDDPLFAGTLEMAGDDLVVEFLQAADLLLVVGVDPVEFDKPWRFDVPTLVVDAVPNREGYIRSDVDLVGSMGPQLEALVETADPSSWSGDAIASHRARLHASTRRDAPGLQPRDVVDAVRAVSPRSTIATSDVGAHKLLVGQTWPAFSPRSFFMANGLSAMGYSIPVAAAANLVHPHRPVVAFVGDGGLGMYLGELETLVRAELSLLIVTFVDGSLELIRRAQLRRDLPPTGVTFASPDYSQLGSAFGLMSREVTSQHELAAALGVMIGMPGVRLLAVHIDRDGYRL